MTVEFKVGDKVRVVNVNGIYGGDDYYFDGFETEVINVGCGGKVFLLSAKGGEGVYINEREIANGVIELIESKPTKPTKPTKKQRITALEQEVAALKQQMQDLQTRFGAIPQHEQPTVSSVSYGFEKPGEVTGEIGTERTHISQLTPNEQRKLIIEKAKQFIESCKNENGYYKARAGGAYLLTRKVDFIVDVEKRTVVALLKGFKKVYTRGIAKCMPDDVFNEHIGKAIALGRALGIDVSEFENAVQPTEIVVGHTVQNVHLKHLIGKVTKFDEVNKSWRGGRSFRHTCDDGWMCTSRCKILVDTDAQY